MLLDVQNLCVSFKTPEQTKQVVKGVSFTLNPSEIIGIIGESGSGKSVTCQSISRLIPAAQSSGTATYVPLQTDLLSCSKHSLENILRTEIAYIFQEPLTALNPLLRCGDQIIEGSTYTKNDLKELLHQVELFDDSRISNSFPHQLSGGQRQRVMIAMALAKKPKILIADEPTTALDVAVQSEILDLIKKLAQEKELGVLFITHDIRSLENFATKTLVMYKGQIVEQGSTGAIINRPKHAYTKALLQSRAGYLKKGFRLSELDELITSTEQGLAYKKPQKVALNEVPTGEEILALNSISKSHFKKSLFKTQETKVLKGLSLTVNKGDSLGIIGESGSGKSTIAKLVLRLWDPTDGTITLEGISLNQLKDSADKVQMVFQDPYSSLNPKHKVGKAIAAVRKLKGDTKARESAEQLLIDVGLSKRDFDKYPHEFSGGQRQRIGIAKALAREPEILVLDEAVSALDVSVQAKILNLLNDLKEKKSLTYLFISHDMNVVSYFCNRVVVLKEGEIIEQGAIAEVVENPASSYTKSLLTHSIN